MCYYTKTTIIVKISGISTCNTVDTQFRFLTTLLNTIKYEVCTETAVVYVSEAMSNLLSLLKYFWLEQRIILLKKKINLLICN